MDHAVFVCIIEPLKHLYDYLQSLARWPVGILQNVLEIRPFDELHGEEQPPVVLASVNDVNNVGVRHLGQSGSFALESVAPDRDPPKSSS